MSYIQLLMDESHWLIPVSASLRDQHPFAVSNEDIRLYPSISRDSLPNGSWNQLPLEQ